MPTANAPVERVSADTYANNAIHVSRYEFAYPYILGAQVLDIACGEGYGSQMLATQGARLVIGIDINFEVLQGCHARALSQKTNFVQATAINLPTVAEAFDAIVCLETLEHVQDAASCLAEFSRLLKPTGYLILSTPNALITKPINGKPLNPYHVREYTPPELRALLQKNFGHVELHGQRIRKGGIDTSPYGRPLRKILDLIPPEWRRSLPALLPSGVGERLVKTVTGHGVTLIAQEYEFVREGVEDCYVLMAVCKK